MTYLELLKLLLPQGVYTEDAASLTIKDLSVAASALEAAQANADDIIEDEIWADAADEFLPEWERLYGITPDAAIAYSARIDNLMAAVRATGGMTRGYYIGLAATLGYTITIDEFMPFMAGWSEVGVDALYTEDSVYVWQVSVSNSSTPQYRLRAGVSRAGDRLLYFSDDFFEALFNRLKPAHTAVVFAYL